MTDCPVCGAAHLACGGPSSLRYDPTDIQPMALPTSKTMWRSEKRIYLDKDDKIVTDPETQDAVKLLVAENGEIPLELAQRHGLTEGGMTGGGELAASAVPIDAFVPKETHDLLAQDLAAVTAERDAKASDLQKSTAAQVATQRALDKAKADLAAATGNLTAVTAERDALKG